MKKEIKTLREIFDEKGAGLGVRKDIKESLKNLKEELKEELKEVNHHALTWSERNSWVNSEIDELFKKHIGELK